jgi:hypothetical protein
MIIHFLLNRGHRSPSFLALLAFGDDAELIQFSLTHSVFEEYDIQLAIAAARSKQRDRLVSYLLNFVEEEKEVEFDLIEVMEPGNEEPSEGLVLFLEQYLTGNTHSSRSLDQLSERDDYFARKAAATRA